MTAKKVWKTIGKVVGILVGACVLLFLIVLLVMTVTEYKPDDVETLEVTGEATETIAEGDSLTVVTWNIGYAALGADADFFMDGGQYVAYSDKELVYENLEAIEAELTSLDADIMLLQEVDTLSTRAHYINEMDELTENLPGYTASFAYNYKVLWVPYPIPNVGRVEAGLLTLSRYEVTEAEREALYCPFSYPIRLGNLKRCLMVSRIPVEGSDKELVIVNLHLEAYDSGEGKVEQTKMLRELLEEEAAKGNYVIAAGDFNQTFSTADTSAYAEYADDIWTPGIIDVDEFDTCLQFVMDTTTPSCRSLDQPYRGADPDTFAYYVIDGFIISDNITIQSAETQDLGFENSDHNPLVVELTLD